MVRTMRGCWTACLQPECTEEPETNLSVSQQEEHSDAIKGKAIEDYKLDIDYKPVRSDPEIMPVNQVEEKATLMQSMQRGSSLSKGLCNRGLQTIRLQKGSSLYIKHKDLRLWPHGYSICTYGLDLVLRQLSEDRD